MVEKSQHSLMVKQETHNFWSGSSILSAGTIHNVLVIGSIPIAGTINEGNVMTNLEFILTLEVIPMSVERPCTIPSISEIKRWFNNKAIVIGGNRPAFNDTITFPVTELVFFPNGKRKTTVI